MVKLKIIGMIFFVLFVFIFEYFVDEGFVFILIVGWFFLLGIVIYFLKLIKFFSFLNVKGLLYLLIYFIFFFFWKLYVGNGVLLLILKIGIGFLWNGIICLLWFLL